MESAVTPDSFLLLSQGISQACIGLVQSCSIHLPYKVQFDLQKKNISIGVELRYVAAQESMDQIKCLETSTLLHDRFMLLLKQLEFLV